MGKKDDKEKEGRESKVQEKAGKKSAKAVPSFLDDNVTLRNTLAQIEKEFGEGSIMPLGADRQAPIEGISSGGLSVDLALGGKGFPRGRIIEVFGPESSGKTTLALHAVAAANPNVVVVLVNGSTVVLGDVEPHAVALVEAWLGGQAAGGAIADVLSEDNISGGNPLAQV